MEITAIYKGHSQVTEGVAQGTGNAWRKVTAIFETTGDYPKNVAFTAMNSNCEQVMQLQAGKLYRISFDLSSREYNGKWYTDAKAWAFNEPNAADNMPTQQPPVQQRPVQTNMFNQPAPTTGQFDPKADDLPF